MRFAQKYKFKKYIYAFVCLALSLHAFHLYAEAAAELGEIRVEASPDAGGIEAPSSFATVIKPEDENVQFESVSELISKSVGVTARSLGGLGQFSTVSIRGSSPEQVSVFLDGVQLNTAAGGAFDFSTIPIDIIERIEIIRGGGSAQFGGGAIGGVINIVTKSAKKGRAIEMFGGGGSFTTFKLGGSYSERFKKNSLTISAAHFQSRGDYKFKTNPVRLSGAAFGIGGGQTFTRIHNGFFSESFLANWKHDFTKDVRLNILNDFFFTNRQVPGTEEETTLLYPTNPLDAKEQIFRNTNSISLIADEFFIKPLNLTTQISNNLDIDIFKDATPAIGTAIDTTTYNYSLDAGAKLRGIFDHGFMNQIVTFRYDYNFYYLNDSSPIATTSLTGRKTRNVNSVALQDELAFFKDRLILMPVVRYEHATDFGGDISYKAGTKVAPVEWLAFKANFERSFRYPSFNELYYPDQGYIRGNPALDKEKAWNLDAGGGVYTKYASLEVAYFRNWVDNSILFVPISATTIAPVNTFKVIQSGIEVEGTVDPIKYVHLEANYTYLNAHYKSNNNQLPGRPKHEFNARVELSYDWSKKFTGTLFGDFNYKNELPINPANTTFLAARSTVDLGLNLRFAKHYYFTLNAKNITNVQTYDARGFPLPRLSFFGVFGAKWS